MFISCHALCMWDHGLRLELEISFSIVSLPKKPSLRPLTDVELDFTI